MKNLTITIFYLVLTSNAFSQLHMRALQELRNQDTKKELDSIVCFKYVSEEDSTRYTKLYYWESANDKVADRIYYYRWVDNWWYPWSLLETTADGDGNITEEVYSLGHGSAYWKDDEKYEHTYDSQNRKTSMKFYEKWPVSGSDTQWYWRKIRRDDYTYTETDIGYENKTVNYVRNSVTEDWKKSRQTLIVRNSDSILHSKYSMKWNLTESLWDTTSHCLYDFPNEHEEINTYIRRDKTGTSWVPDERYHNFYNYNGIIEKKLFFGWDSNLEEWELVGKSDYTYFGDENATISDSVWNVEGTDPVLEDVTLHETNYIKEGVYDTVRVYEWNANTRELYPNRISVYEWDNHDNITKRTNFRLNTVTANWDTTSMEIHAYNEVKQTILGTSYLFTDNIRRGRSRKKYEYNEDGDLNFYDEHTWDEATWEWNLFKRNFYYYKKPVVTYNANFNESHLKIYPNPAQDYLHITNLEGQSKITVTTLNGSEILNAMVTENSFTLNLTGHAPGVYVVRIVNDNGNFVKKVLKQ